MISAQVLRKYQVVESLPKFPAAAAVAVVAASAAAFTPDVDRLLTSLFGAVVKVQALTVLSLFASLLGSPRPSF